MKVLVVDDDNIVSESLKIILAGAGDIEVVATGNSGADAVRLYEEYMPDVLVSDIRMENMTGLEAGEQILAKHPDAKILYLTTFLDDEYIIKALSIGAKGYMLKQNFEGLATAVSAVAAGQNVYGTEIISKIPGLLKTNSKSEKFDEMGITEKEFEIIEEIADGLSNKEIAAKLFLSEGTVRNYISQILLKLDLRDRTQIAIYYYKNMQEKF